MNRQGALALLLALAGALALRLPKLDARPLHNDEGVNAVKLTALWEKGEYAYDPDEFHGPTLYYFSLPVLWLSPVQDSAHLDSGTLRVVTVLFGAGLILLLLLLGGGLGRTAIVWAAVFMAVSPAMVFYSRYFIHEMLLAFFTMLTIAAGWRYRLTRGAGWALLAGAGVGLMFATKETFVFSLSAMGLAVIAASWWNQWRNQRSALVSGGKATGFHSPFALRPLTAAWNWRHAALAGLAGAVLWLLFFSSFFTNAHGLLDSLRTYLPWVKRAGGDSPHIHPWFFYFERLAWFHQPKSRVWSEGLILALALVGAWFAFCSNKAVIAQPALARFLTFYTVILTAIYSLISYKTPWCLLSFFLGMILLAGVGASALLQVCRRKVTKGIVFGILLVGTAQLAWSARQASLTYATSRGNPYVYAQTLPAALELTERIEAIVRVAPDGFDTVLKVIAPESYWPLPWYLRRFNHVGWWNELPDDPYAPIILVSSRLQAGLDERSNKAWLMAGLYELRPGVFLELYVETGLWKKYVATLPRETE